MIAYKWKGVGVSEQVFLDGKFVGIIKRNGTGWQYCPKGSEIGGEIFDKISDCEDSLEGGAWRGLVTLLPNDELLIIRGVV